MAKSIAAVLLLVLLSASLGGCYVGVRAGPGWHRCGWGWCRG